MRGGPAITRWVPGPRGARGGPVVSRRGQADGGLRGAKFPAGAGKAGGISTSLAPRQATGQELPGEARLQPQAFPPLLLPPGASARQRPIAPRRSDGRCPDPGPAPPAEVAANGERGRARSPSALQRVRTAPSARAPIAVARRVGLAWGGPAATKYEGWLSGLRMRGGGQHTLTVQ
jgi:hypothetical protein